MPPLGAGWQAALAVNHSVGYIPQSIILSYVSNSDPRGFNIVTPVTVTALSATSFSYAKANNLPAGTLQYFLLRQGPTILRDMRINGGKIRIAAIAGQTVTVPHYLGAQPTTVFLTQYNNPFTPTDTTQGIVYSFPDANTIKFTPNNVTQISEIFWLALYNPTLDLDYQTASTTGDAVAENLVNHGLGSLPSMTLMYQNKATMTNWWQKASTTTQVDFFGAGAHSYAVFK